MNSSENGSHVTVYITTYWSLQSTVTKKTPSNYATKSCIWGFGCAQLNSGTFSGAHLAGALPDVINDSYMTQENGIQVVSTGEPRLLPRLLRTPTEMMNSNFILQQQQQLDNNKLA